MLSLVPWLKESSIKLHWKLNWVNCTDTPVQIPTTGLLIIYSWHMEPCQHVMVEFLAKHAVMVCFLPQCFLTSAMTLWRTVFSCCKCNLAKHLNSCTLDNPHFESMKTACNFPERKTKLVADIWTAHRGHLFIQWSSWQECWICVDTVYFLLLLNNLH